MKMRVAAKLFRHLACLLLVAALSSCAPVIKQSPAPPTPVATDYPADLHGATLYRLAPEQSKLYILVYRGGTLANLGHNHVISSATLSGYVWLHESLAKSGFTLQLPVNELTIDAPQARAEHGADFATTVTDEARAGTKRNVLKPEQLDGLQYPLIRLRSVNISGTRAQPAVRVQITIKNQSREFEVPVKLSTTDKTLNVTGQFAVRQTDFGIQPYSVAMGAIQVLDQLTIKFELAAQQLP